MFCWIYGLLLFLFPFIVRGALGPPFIISYTQSSKEISVSGPLNVTGAPVTVGTTTVSYTMTTAGTIAFNIPPLPTLTSLSSLNAALAAYIPTTVTTYNYLSVSLIDNTTGVYARLEQTPWLQFYIGSASTSYNIHCAGNPWDASNPLCCYDISTSASVAVFFPYTDTPDWRNPAGQVSFAINTSYVHAPDIILQSNLITLASFLAYSKVVNIDTVEQVRRQNNIRAREANQVVLAIYFLLAAGFLTLCIKLGFLCAWLIPLLDPRLATLIWALVWIIVSNFIVIAPGGVLAWLILLIIYGFFISVVGAYSMWHFRHHCLPTGKPPRDIELEEPGGGGGSGGSGDANWKNFPHPVGHSQRKAIISLNVLLAMWGIIIIAVYFTWNPAIYSVWNRETHGITTEYAPNEVARLSALVYAHHSVATEFRYQYLAATLASPCKEHGDDDLPTNSSRYSSVYKAFIELYGIDMTPFVEPNYWQYTSVNDWFTRAIRPDARPIEDVTLPNVLTAPADARYMVFLNVSVDFPIWVKRDKYDLNQLLNNPSLGKLFEGGNMMIARLAPADYHRFHSPVTGTLGMFDDAGSSLLSVNHDAVVSNNYVFYNKRQIAVINSPSFGSVAYVTVGATCVGTIIITAGPPCPVTHGDQLGYFKFGGSTVVMLFQKDAVTFDPDILYNSQRHVETFIKMGRRMGIAN